MEILSFKLTAGALVLDILTLGAAFQAFFARDDHKNWPHDLNSKQVYNFIAEFR